MLYKKFFLVWLIILLGCAYSEAKPVLPGDLPSSPAALRSSLPEFKEVRILNEATDRRTRIFLLGNAQVPIDFPAPSKQTVEEDLQRYLDARVTVFPAAPRRLVVTISRAEAYWILPLDQKVVIDEFRLEDLSPVEKEFVLELKVLFEAQETGQTGVSYLFDQKISLPDGRSEFPGEIQDSYKRLLDRYRKVFFNAVEREFLGKPW